MIESPLRTNLFVFCEMLTDANVKHTVHNIRIKPETTDWKYLRQRVHNVSVYVEVGNSTDPKLGYDSCMSDWYFDDEGKFIAQGAYEV